MTQEEKAKAYDDALERARKIHSEIVNNEIIGFPGQIEDIFPQLRESEDERMIREFNDWLCEEIECRTNDLRDEKDRRTLNMLCYVLTKVKDWLEKQKEQRPSAPNKYDEKMRKKIIDHLESIKMGCVICTIDTSEEIAWLEKQKENPKSADSIPEDCVSLAKCEDRDSKYGVFPEDVIVVARACEKLEAHGYSELAHALKNVNLYTKPIDYDHEMWKNCEANFEGGKKEVIDHPEKYGLQKEQKPISSYDIVPYIDDKIAELQDMWREEKVSFDWDDMKDMIEDVARHFYQKEPKPAEWSEDIIRKAVKEVGLTQHQIDWFKTNVFPPKPAWSEEDEKMLNEVLNSVTYAFYDQGNEGEIEDDPAFLWLHRLRPSWKPSEEQMNALNFAITFFMHETNYKNPTELRDLYDDLLKLK